MLRPAVGAGARYTGFGAGGKWEDLNCVAHFRYDVNGYLASAGSRYKTVEVLHSHLGHLHARCARPECKQRACQILSAPEFCVPRTVNSI